MGQPLFEIRDLVRRHNVIVKSSNYALYGDISRRVMTLVASEVPDSAIYSIDEIFIDLDNMSINHDQWARDLKAKILRETGIPVGIGISTTKTLAKIANRLAKKSFKADGVLMLKDQKWIDLALERTEAGDVWGVGRKFAQKARQHRNYHCPSAPRHTGSGSTTNDDSGWLENRAGVARHMLLGSR